MEKYKFIFYHKFENLSKSKGGTWDVNSCARYAKIEYFYKLISNSLQNNLPTIGVISRKYNDNIIKITYQ